MFKITKIKKSRYKIVHMFYNKSIEKLIQCVIIDNINSLDLTTYLARNHVSYEEISITYRRLRQGAKAAYFGSDNSLFYIA